MKPPELNATFITAAVIGLIAGGIAFVAIAVALTPAQQRDRTPGELARDLLLALLGAVVAMAVVVGIAIAWYQLKWTDYHRRANK